MNDAAEPNASPPPVTVSPIRAQGEQHCFYHVETADGQELTGIIVAQSIDQARHILQNQNLNVLDIQPRRDAPTAERQPGMDSATQANRGTGKMSLDQMRALSDQLASLTEAGLPLESSLRLIAQDLGRGKSADALRSIADDLEAGVALGEAFERQQKNLDLPMGPLVEAGIATGQLPRVLMGMSQFMEQYAELRRKLLKVLAYPMLMLLLFAGVGGAMAYIFAGNIRNLKMQTHTDLAWTMQIQSAEFADYGIALTTMIGLPILSALLGGVLAMALWQIGRIARRSGPGIWQDAPILGRFIRDTHTTRWCRFMALAVEAHLPIPRALEQSKRMYDWPQWQADLDHLLDGISGKALQIDATLRKLTTIPHLPAATILKPNAGDQLAMRLESLSQFYLSRADRRAEMLMSWLGPIMLVCMGLLIGLYITTMFLVMQRLIGIAPAGGF